MSWWFVAVGTALSLLVLVDDSNTLSSFAFDALAIVAAAGAVYGILRNRPDRRWLWLLLSFGVILFAAGDVAWDAATRGAGGSTGYPWADVLYLLAYPLFAIALYQLARHHFHRDTVVDSAIVALAASALVWQWVITPVVQHTSGATIERIVAAAYPVMDVVLVVAIVHAVFALPRWTPAAWFLFGGLTVLLIADTMYARLVVDGTYTDGGFLDALWPVSYFLLAGAALHPSMRELWLTDRPGLVRQSRVRMLVLGAALFMVPAVVVADASGSTETVALTVIIGITAGLVAWRIGRLVAETSRAREVLGDSEARFRAFVQHSSDVVGVIDGAGIITYVSPSVSSVFGYQPAQLLGTPVAELVHPSDLDAAARTIASLADRPLESESVEFRGRHANGSWRWTEATVTNQMHESAVRGIVGNFRDMTERRRADMLSARETAVLEQILGGAGIPDTLHRLLEAVEEYVGDAAATIRLVDEAGEPRRLTSPSLPPSFVDEIDDRLASLVDDAEAAYNARSEPIVVADIADDHRFPQLQALRNLALANGFHAFWSVPIRTPDDSRMLGMLAIYVRNARPPSDGERLMLDRVRNVVGVALDRAAHTRQLGHLALHDTLTGLPNRALAVERLESALDRAWDGTSKVAVLFLDLDRFKVVNDGLGHDTGDELLVAVGRRLAATVRRSDTVARFGGDEFVVICEDLYDIEQAEELADRAIGALGAPFALDHAEVVVSASIGIAVTGRGPDRAERLLRDADAAMYRAKSRGGARYELFDQAMHTAAVSRLLTERGLREALERDELRVLFQPQFELATRTKVAEEALLRWLHPVRGVVAPREFIEVAEETGLIVPIGTWVLARACEHARDLRDQRPGEPGCVSLNISARQLLRPDFTCAVRVAVRDYDLDPSVLCLEFAERLLLDDQETTGAALRTLKDLGVRLAIDDFGSGGSSLTYLRRYPFDELKIDRAFVTDLGDSAADDAIVAATIDMAHALGMVVSAEGVETELQRVRLLELGCDRAQGFFLAPPEAPVSRHLKLIRQLPA
ncbi:MAG TPA: EAL domain-containing protein [Acidimicrobiia bacterium]|nr:EAL domain-containing protein [Acidimicrobiia bacterium]